MGLSVEDQLAIQQLYARYNHAIDSGNGAAWADCFTPGGTFSSGSGNFAGTEQLAAFATGFASRVKGRHWINNLVVDADDDGAKGSCYLVLWKLNDPGTPPNVLTTAIYHDTLAKAGGQWKFSSRTVKGDA